MYGGDEINTSQLVLVHGTIKFLAGQFKVDKTESIQSTYLEPHTRIESYYNGESYVFAYIAIDDFIEFTKSDTYRTLPSFLGIIKVGDAHLEAPHFCRTPISHNHCNSVLKTSK
jgi:hypothetical protein